jgi:copper chaperone CopZ
MSSHLAYTVPGMSCGHCERAVKDEIGGVAGVASVSVDLDAREVEPRQEKSRELLAAVHRFARTR